MLAGWIIDEIKKRVAAEKSPTAHMGGTEEKMYQEYIRDETNKGSRKDVADREERGAYRGRAAGGGGGRGGGASSNWWNDITGATAANEAEALREAAIKQNAEIQKRMYGVMDQEQAAALSAQQRQAELEAGVSASMGANVGEYMQRMREAAAADAEAAGQIAATQGSRAALQAARTGGVPMGQAALAGGRQAGDIYSGVYTGALQQGKQAYQQGTQQFMDRASQAAAQRQAAAGTQMGAGGVAQGGIGLGLQAAGQAQGLSQAQAAGTSQMVSAGMQALPGIIAAFSDERLKTDVTEGPDVSEVADAIEPRGFRYNWDVPGTERVGAMAQDLERSPLAETVIETPQGKAIDTGQLTMGLLNMVVQMQKEIEALAAKRGGKKNG